MEEALIGLLLAVSPLAALAGDRIFPLRIPQGLAMPAVAVSRIDGTPNYTNSGASGLVSSRVQADLYGRTYLEAKTMARALVGALSGYRGTTGGIEFQGIFVDSQRDLAATDAGDVNALFRVSVDLIIHHN